MAKSLSERIAAGVNTKSAQNRAAFLALREEIAQARRDGWPIKNIWETLHKEDKITFGYESFTLYVKRFIPPDPLPNSGSVAKSKPPAVERSKEKETKTTTMEGFSYNPNPDKEALI
jgi:hypothetical protein